MKIYRSSFYDPHQGQMLMWHTSRRAAEGSLAKERRERDGVLGGPVDVLPVDITPTRTGIVRWLNRHFQTDNG